MKPKSTLTVGECGAINRAALLFAILLSTLAASAPEAVETFDVNWKSDDFPVSFGNQSQFPEKGRWWDGWLDEARVMDVVKDDHWIKLEYESQREGQKFLSFGKSQKRF